MNEDENQSAAPATIGSYRIMRLLGAGGMGKVYEAKRDGVGESIALKVFSCDDGKARFLRERFETEGKVLARLKHPRLVQVFESGIDAATGSPYYAMTLVRDANGRSTTLHDVCGKGKVTEARAEVWYADLCDVLDYCHRSGVVHRDVKLGNVLLDADDHAVLSDFGVSRIVASDLRTALDVTTTFVTGETLGTRPVMGSYWYLAPEVRRGEGATPASDWYALGALFFRLLTGMWYEPGTAALDLLAPYDPIWRERIERLLDDDPAKRTPLRGPECAPRVGCWRRFLLLCGAIAALSVAALGIACWVRPSASVAAVVWHPKETLTFAIDATNRLAFCACPSGTNAIQNLSVRVTRPYWLGATPVTRRQYFAALGEPLTAWAGGADAPMTYLTRGEMTNFCARLNERFAARLPKGYEFRLPTLAEWRLAYAQGGTDAFADKDAMRRVNEKRGWFGQNDSLRRCYESLNVPTPLVADIWPDFPPRRINLGQEDWMRTASQVPPAPVALTPPNALGLYDMVGNCAERVADTCATNRFHWGRTEWGVTTTGLYAGQGLVLTDPVERSGDQPLMVGSYLAPDLAADRAWSADFDRLPHLGFRLCLGPKLSR